jgi:hypothetical protein
LIVLHSAGCLSASGQSYAINWYKISGGGGTSSSSNGQYSVSGIIGQPDASGTLSGGQYSLTGGFWSLISVVQTPGAPTLSVSYSASNVIVSWPSPSTGYVLQQNGSLNTGNWTASSYSVNSNSTTLSITIPSPTGNLFFRLVNP